MPDHNISPWHSMSSKEKLPESPNNLDQSIDATSKSVEKSDTIPKTTTDNDQTDDRLYPTGLRLVLIFVSLCISTLLVALDGTILATAIPTISSDFNSLSDVAWYNSAFLLTTCAFQIPYGRAYTLLSTKWVYLSSIIVFEVGSVVCGAAPTSTALIIGRAIAGVGGAGIFSGCFIIISNTVPLRKRSLFIGFIGATFGIASVVGPLLGGAFTIHVSWRWCFYINLPVGAIAFVVVIFFLPRSVDVRSTSFKGSSWLQIIGRFDPLGTVLFLISIICLQLALQWGGLQYPWSSPRVIATLVVFGILFIIWVFVQWREGENATVPLDIAAQRSVAGATVYTLCASASFTAVVFYLPIWFQAIKGDNAIDSGIHNLPLILSVIISSIAAGGAVVLVGYYVPFLFLGTVLASVGAGLLMTLEPSSGPGKWIGYQIIFGFGIGVSIEQCNIAIQTVLPDEKIPAGTSLSVFARSLGGSIAVAIAQNVFEQKLRQNLAAVIPNLDPSIVSGSGATNLVANVQEVTGGNQQTVDTVLDLYSDALSQAFLAALILAALSLLPAFAMEWKSVKKEKAAQDKKKEGRDEDKNDSAA